MELLLEMELFKVMRKCEMIPETLEELFKDPKKKHVDL